MRKYDIDASTDQGKFLDYVDSWFSIHGEAREDKGEDSFLYILKDEIGLISVFDGCGGSGARLYPSYGNRTGAYIASRVLAQATSQWFDDLNVETNWDDETNCSILKNYIDNLLQFYRNQGGRVSALKGKLIREFPSTLSAAVMRTEGSTLMVNFIWSGDSRGYVLDSAGLHQATTDDLSGRCDAMKNLYEDSPMNNVISASESYVIHQNKVTLSMPCIVFTATDGCFGYVKSPMEFERILLEQLMQSETIDEWRRRIQEVLSSISGDDYTMCMVAIGFETFDNIKKYYNQRLLYLNHYYPFTPKTGTEELFNQWNKYRIEYERYMNTI